MDNTLFKQYQQLLKKEKRFVRLYQLIILLLFFGGWELLSRLEWIDRLIFSSPTHVWHTFIEKVSDGTLTLHVGVTLMETVIGFIAGTLLGTLIAIVLWWSPLLSKVLDPYLVILNAMPKVA
ncbi:MAG TPA: ABC transporter permease, partial [Lysinibacillus sp.]|nr:ABC transporter permease [Lysinibacillus sp.]